MMKTIKVICLDCFRVMELDLEEYLARDCDAMGGEFCECGGQVCHCDMCMKIADALEIWKAGGCLGYFTTGLECALKSWDADSGAVIAEDVVVTRHLDLAVMEGMG